MSDRPRGWNSTLPARSKPLERNTELRSAPIRPTPKGKAARKRKVERKAERFAHAYHSLERVFFVSRLPCAVPGCERRPSVNAHLLGADGVSRKGHHSTVGPLCLFHEKAGEPDSFHTLGPETFADTHELDLVAVAEETHRRWLEEGAAVVAAAKADGSFQAWRSA